MPRLLWSAKPSRISVGWYMDREQVDAHSGQWRDGAGAGVRRSRIRLERAGSLKSDQSRCVQRGLGLAGIALTLSRGLWVLSIADCLNRPCGRPACEASAGIAGVSMTHSMRARRFSKIHVVQYIRYPYLLGQSP